MADMAAKKMEWMLNGDCTEACTSPPVCPYYWRSSTPTNLHEGKNQCEGTFTFSIKQGRHGETDLKGLKVGLGFNTPVGGPASRDPWKTILYIDEHANDVQAKALEEIFTTSWRRVGDVLKVKRVAISFCKEQVGSAAMPGFKHAVEWEGIYKLKAEPIMTTDGAPRYISGLMNGMIYVGKSTENSFHDPDLPRGNWDRPGMSNTYFEFTLNPEKLEWMP
jgi:hypothetical protein